MRRLAAGISLTFLMVAGCRKDESTRPAPAQPASNLPADQREAETLGREVFEMVDRAVDYRGSHRGRPAVNFRQMGIDSLTDLTVRRLLNLDRDPVVTVAFRRTETREITSCRGDSQVLEEASLNGGRFTVMCTLRSGDQRPFRVSRTE